MADDDVLTEAREAFELASDVEAENRNLALDDLRFARLSDQWPTELLRQRQLEGKPSLVINKIPAFIRQVVNDARLNKPQLKVHPVDSAADVDTAQLITALVRNIEYSSNADVAYDTAGDFAVTMGFGYFRIDVDYSHDDAFDQDIRVERVSDPFTVYGDPHSTAADSSDWNSAFIVEAVPREVFQRKYKGGQEVDWDVQGYSNLRPPWFDDDNVLVAEWYRREEVEREIVRLSDGNVVDADVFAKQIAPFAQELGIVVIGQRKSRSHKVTHYVLTGAEVLETVEWPGRYIPIVPVYGDEISVEGRRYFKSLIRDAKDAQRMFNYWRSATTELVALAPKAPFVGPEMAFEGKDSRKWETANTEAHAYLAYAGSVTPQRQPFAGVPAGALQEAMNANDDMKAIIGLYDASLGARSNETSGRAIMARQREGDVSTFHFLDNLNRAIKHGGRIMLDLIPHVYSGERIVRVMGEDGSVANARLGPERIAPPQQMQQQARSADSEFQEKFMGVYSLGAGKYDLAVDVGPSFTTRRQEAAEQMIELLRAFPQAAPVIGDLLAKNLDWPGAQEIAERLRSLLPPAAAGADPRMMQMAQQLQQMEAKLRELSADKQVDLMKVVNSAYDAETKRIKVLADAATDVASAVSPPGPYDRFEQGARANGGF
jgi:hypothetical protein